MRSQPVALERFEAFADPDPAARASGQAAPEGSPGSDLVPAVALAEDEPEAAPDPAAERQARLERIACAVELVAAEQAGLRARCIADATEALGAAVECLLPALARAGFAALAAEAAVAICRSGRWPNLQLAVSPADLEDVRGALGTAHPGPLQIEADPALGPGEAEFAWQDGGAALDIAALVAAATEVFRHRLQSAAAPGATDQQGTASP